MRRIGNRRMGSIWQRRPGFTLIELLVVITLIGMLMAMVVPAVFGVISRVRETQISTEITKLDGGVKSFFAQFQRYPPDGTKGGGKGSKDPIKEFTIAVFPDMEEGGRGGGGGGGSSQATSEIKPDTALYFWLTQLNRDPRNPFKATSSAGGQQVDDKYKFYDFLESRVLNKRYYPPNATPGSDPPYVYFQRDTYTNASVQVTNRSGANRAMKPYNFGKSRNSSGGSSGGGQQYDWAASDSFQIIAAGLDNEMGTGGQLGMESSAGGGGEPISLEDEDNIVNFDSKRVKDISR